MTLNRRTFLQVLAAGSTTPGLLRGADAQQASRGKLVWQPAPCPLCDVGCGMLVGVQDGRAVAVKPQLDALPNQGLACARGYYSVQALYGGDRLRHALVRRNDKLVPVSLDDAYDLIAGKLRETQLAHGRASVAAYGSSSWSITDAQLARELFRNRLGSPYLETDASLFAASALTGAATSFGTRRSFGSMVDVEHADVIVLWNHNIAETDPVIFSRILERRRRYRVKVVEVATRTTRTSYGLDRSIIYAPQAEIALANAICHEIVTRKAHNGQFIDDHVAFRTGDNRIGYGSSDVTLTKEATHEVAFGEYVKFLADYPPRKIQPISAVAPADIAWLASLYADPARRVLSIWGPELGQHARGTWVNNAVNNIHLLTGKLGSPGNGTLTLSGQGNGAATLHAAVAGRADGRMGPLSLFRALEQGLVRFLWVQGSNPVVSLPNLQRYRRAFAAADRFIVVSDAYPTKTTDIADVVLPSALWVERTATYANADGRLQHIAALLTPPGDARSDASHMREVAQRLGIKDLREAELPALALPPVEALRARVWLRPYQPPPEAPNGEYPYWLSVGAVLEHAGTGTLTRRIPILHRAVPRAYVEVNASDAHELGIRDRDLVKLSSRRGAVTLPARVNQRSQPARGSVFVPVFDEDIAINLLTLDACCPLSGQPAYHTAAVRMERV